VTIPAPSPEEAPTSPSAKNSRFRGFCPRGVPVAVLSRVEPTLEIEIVCDGMSETYTFAEFPVRIGRDESCELHLERPFVSRKHARLERGVHGGFVLVDEGGRNGVALGGLKLARDNQIELVDGAEFTIETLVAKVHIREADEKATSLYGEHHVVPELLARAGAAMEAYRAARAEALAVVSDSLAAIPEPQRASMIERLLSLHEELATDPGFRSLISISPENPPHTLRLLTAAFPGRLQAVV